MGTAKQHWRRDRDSNPGITIAGDSCLAGKRLKPLGHLSKYLVSSAGFDPATFCSRSRRATWLRHDEKGLAEGR